MTESSVLNLLVLSCILAWGVVGIVDKLALEQVSYKAFVLAVYAFSLPTAGVVGLVAFATQPRSALSPEVIFWSACAAAAQFFSLLLYLKAMSRLEASFVIGITAAYPMITQLIAASALGESLWGTRLAGAALIGVGITAIAVSQKSNLTGNGNIRVIGCVVLCTLLWSVVGIFDKKAVACSSALGAYYAKCLCNLVLLAMALAWLYYKRALPSFASLKLWQFASLSALLMTIGNLAYIEALALAPASYVIVITGCYPVVMYACALVFLKERLNVKRLSGVCVIVLGAVLTQLTQSL
ncbi:MAG TPA: EamA family transporter [Candidatus Obscuribacterales bacterium]